MQGKRAESTCELIESPSSGQGELGYDRFCISQNFPGFPGLGIIFNGEDWNGLIRASSMSWVKGPMYCCFVHSLCSISPNVLLGGVNDCVDYLLKKHRVFIYEVKGY